VESLRVHSPRLAAESFIRALRERVQTVKEFYDWKKNLRFWWFWASGAEVTAKKKKQSRKHPSTALRAGERRHEKIAYLIDIAINIFFRFLFRAFHLSCFRGRIVALLSAFLSAGFKAAPALLKQALTS
jgi:hypothetical protein